MPSYQQKCSAGRGESDQASETREYLGGYYILDMPDLDTALDWAGKSET
jgi:YCII-related domain